MGENIEPGPAGWYILAGQISGAQKSANYGKNKEAIYENRFWINFMINSKKFTNFMQFNIIILLIFILFIF